MVEIGGGWGRAPWGGDAAWGAGVDLPLPILHAVHPTVLEIRGGTVLGIFGENFFDPMTVEVLDAGEVVGTGYIFDAEFDLERNRAYAGMPAMAEGVYDLRVTTAGGDSNVLEGALDYRLHSEQAKVHGGRIKFSSTWKTGPRTLTSGQDPTVE
jgi:hypothetical protein